MSNHTPGPWHIGRDSKCQVVSSAGDPIAWIKHTESPNPIEDARLIAAAPELLANVKQLNHLIRQFISGALVTFPVSALAQADDVIAKAVTS